MGHVLSLPEVTRRGRIRARPREAEVKRPPEVGAIGLCCWDGAVGGAWPVTQAQSLHLKPTVLYLVQQPESQKLLFLFCTYGEIKTERGQGTYLSPYQYYLT